jgi:glycosyltransferase involved in cell wall biosynthesis
LKLLVVGDGPDLATLKALVRAEGVEDAVVFAGWSDNPTLVYAAMDALVIPSRYEGFPLVMLQAMYLRLPVIASAVDGMVDTLPPHWLFPSGDASALAARLVEAVNANEQPLLDEHREMVVQRFSMPVFELAFMAALRAAVERAGRRQAKPP